MIAEWIDATGAMQRVVRRIRVAILPGFPYRQPSAFIMDKLDTVPEGRHLAPVQNGAMCLYAASYRPDTQRGWAPWRTGEEYVERVRELLRRVHAGEWDDADRPPDLHTAFPQGVGVPAMTLIGEGWSPPTHAQSGRFGVWRKSESLAFACGAVAGIDEVARKSPSNTTLIILGLADNQRDAVGAWFRLTREPSPRKTLGGILTEIDRAASQSSGWALAECRRLISADAGGKRPVFLALSYPDRSLAGQEAWLFLEALPESAAKPIRWRERPTLDRAGLRASETVAINGDSLMRRTGPLARAVSGRTVLVFGIGALGSSMALLLARSGVEHLILVDSDRMRPGNVVRHVLSLTDMGKKKTKAMWWEILVHVPDVKIEYFDATWDPANLRAHVSRADVVVDATADQSFNLLLNEICVRADRQLVQVETLRRAAIGRVRIVRARRDACLVCYTEHVKTATYPVVPPGEDVEFFDAGCGEPTVEAPAVDVEATANWAARVVLWLLQDTLGPRNHLLVVNEEVPGLAGELSVVGIHWGVFAALSGCECCDRRSEVATEPGAAAPDE